eukprot:4619784-Prymnesium_polylepis.2
MLFHSLIAHSPEATALQTLDAIIGYVVHFFGCEECATHFAAMAATRECALAAVQPRQAGRQAGRLAGRQAGRQAGWQAGWLAGMETGMETDRLTD